MKIPLLLFLFLFVVGGCSNSGNPVEQLVETKSPDELFAIFGRSLFDGCKTTKSATGKCLAEITDSVVAARNNGYKNVSVDNFTPEVLSKVLVKVSTSLEAGNVRNAKHLTPTRYD